MTFEMRPWLAIAIAAAAVLSAVAGGMQAAANALATRAPTVANQLTDSSPVPLTQIARASLILAEGGTSVDDVDFSAARAPARAALDRSLLSPLPLAVLAWDAEPAERSRILAAAARVNKRDSILQAALIREYEDEEDYSALLSVTNDMMRVHPPTVGQVIPVLMDLLKDRDVVPLFTDLMAPGTPWNDAFMTAASRKPELAANLVELRLSLPATAGITPETDRKVIGNLVGGRRLVEALRLYRATSGKARFGTDRTPPKTIDWAHQFPPFDWALTDSYDAYARPGRSGGLTVRVRPGQTRPLAARLIEIPATATGIRVTHDIGPASALDEMTIETECIEGGAPPAKRAFAPSPFILELGGRAGACNAARLTISARVRYTGEQVDGAITRLEFVTVPD